MINSRRVLVPMLQMLLVLALAIPAVAHARPYSDIKHDDVLRVLRYFGDPVPANFRDCGSGVDSILVDILSGRRVDVELRVRAARALAKYPGNRAKMVLTSMMANPDEDKDVRAACLIAVGKLLGGISIPDIKPFLSDPSPVIRKGAATALAVIGGPRARQVLLDTIQHEPDLDVRMEMDEALNRMSPDESSGTMGARDGN